MKRYLIIASISVALSAPIAYASVWSDVKGAGRDVGHGFKHGWERVAGTPKDAPKEKCVQDAKAASKAADSKTNGCTTDPDKKK